MLNIDNFQELSRVDNWLKTKKSSSAIGLRINPQVGSGSIAAMSTATQSSKFGIGLEDSGNHRLILNAYQARPWLNASHTHVGSQGCSLDLMIAGIARVFHLAQEINRHLGRQQITTIDIGGGLPVNLENDFVTPSFAEYAMALKKEIPELITGSCRVVTEFGRSVTSCELGIYESYSTSNCISRNS